MFRLLASGIALVGVMALAAVFGQSAGSDPALTRAASVLPPTVHQFYINTAAAARFTPWDCSDWQPYPAVADADNQLASSILETLAANRGKTLYCALDQSNTWTKRQVYDHAHAHNDRDRTQYDGSQGQGRFRGFTAGQEGWLTDGEHGITGVSPERIFEFPEQKRRRRWKTITKRLKVPADNSRRILSQYGGAGNIWATNVVTIQDQARQAFGNPSIDWDGLTQTAATAYCQSEGYPRTRNVAFTPTTVPSDRSAFNAGWCYIDSGGSVAFCWVGI